MRAIKVHVTMEQMQVLLDLRKLRSLVIQLKRLEVQSSSQWLEPKLIFTVSPRPVTAQSKVDLYTLKTRLLSTYSPIQI